MNRAFLLILFTQILLKSNSQVLILAEQSYYDGNYSLAWDLAEAQDSNQFNGCDWFVFGNILLKNNQLERADKAYQNASLEQCPSNFELYLNRGICNNQMGNFRTAQELLLLYTHNNTTDFKGHYWLAANYYAQGKNSQALNALENSIELNEKYAPSHFLEGAIWYSKRQYQAALNCMEDAVQIDSTLMAAKLEIGIIYLEMNNYSKSIEIFNEVLLGVNEYRDQAFYFIGESYYFLHNKEKACENWKEGKNLGNYLCSENVQRFCVEGKKPKRRKSTYVAF
jgi:tetratricopeptide (TPR) repeat protein